MLKRLLPSLLMPFLIAAIVALSVQAHAQSRVALVIGNSAYQKVANLPNPAHDAQDVSEALKRLGFSVKTVTDSDFDGFRRALLEFGRVAQKSDMAVFYFAGHGVEISGNNWLLPTDAELKSDIDAATEAIGLQSAMQAVATAKTLGLVILDACRNNPFQSSMRRSVVTRSVQILGLAPVEPTDNVLVAYAARDGTVANDGAGRNSPYTAALLKHIETPGLEIDFLFRNVRDDVMAATNKEQQPFVYGSISSDEIYFKPPPVGIAAADATPPPDAAEIAWSFLKATSDISTLTRFVDRFPESSHIPDARVRIASLATAPSPGVATDAAKLFVPAAFADTDFEKAEKAVARRFVRDTPAVEAAWDVIKDTKDHTVIRHFVDRFPSKKRRVVADTRLVALGQVPISVHAAPIPLVNVDEIVLARAAVDPDVMLCFRGGDQTAPACQRAFERFPDIGRFADDIRFTLSFCQAMGNPTGCMPTVKSTWNFPGSKTLGGLPGADAGTGPKTEMQLDSRRIDIDTSHAGRRELRTESLKYGRNASLFIHNGNGNLIHNRNGNLGKYRVFGTGALKLQQNSGSHISSTDVKTTGIKNTGIKTTNIKTTGIKVTGIATSAIKTPTITTPVVRTPKVDVRAPRINVPVVRIH